MKLNLDTCLFCDLFREAVGSDILQRRTLRRLVKVEGSSQIEFEILSQHFMGELRKKHENPQLEQPVSKSKFGSRFS